MTTTTRRPRPKSVKRTRKADAQRRADKAAVEQLLAELPRWSEPLFIPRRYKVAYGGRGASRSWTFARALLIKAAQSPIRVLCAREFQNSIKDSVHLLLSDQIGLMGITGFEVTRSEIRHTNGSLFLFEGLRHNVTKIKSLEGIDICWVEEAERISKESWGVLIPTIRKAGSEIWVSFNPDEEGDSTYQRFVVKPPQDAWVIHVNWEDNPWFPNELRMEKDYAYATDPEAAAHIWEGQLRKVSAAQILRGKWIVEDFEPCLGHADSAECKDLANGKACSHRWSGPYQGIDFGFSTDPNAAVRCWIHDHKLYVEHELYRHGLDIDHMPKALTDTIPGFDQYVSRADSARPDSISFLKRHGIPRIEGVKKHPGSVEDGITHLRSYIQIIIHSRCKHTVDEAKAYKYKVDERSGDVLPEIVDKFNHLMDCIRYALQPMIKPKGKAGFIFVQSTPPRPTHANGNGNGDGTAPANTKLIGINRR